MHRMQPPQGNNLVIAEMGQPVHGVDAEHGERDEAPAGHGRHAGQHQPRAASASRSAKPAPISTTSGTTSTA
jgi:hypothetical protein